MAFFVPLVVRQLQRANNACAVALRSGTQLRTALSTYVQGSYDISQPFRVRSRRLHHQGRFQLEDGDLRRLRSHAQQQSGVHVAEEELGAGDLKTGEFKFN